MRSATKTEGIFWRETGRNDLAQADFAKAEELRERIRGIGMKITELTEGGAAKKAKLRVGDIIMSVGGKRVRDYNELRAALEKANGPVDMVIINSDLGQSQTISITPEAGGIIGASVVPAEYAK